MPLHIYLCSPRNYLVKMINIKHWKRPVYFPDTLLRFIPYLGKTDLRLLYVLYWNLAVAPNHRSIVWISKKQLIELTNCGLDSIRKSLKILSELELAFLLEESDRDFLIRLTPPKKYDRNITLKENPLPINYLNKHERKHLKKKGQLK